MASAGVNDNLAVFHQSIQSIFDGWTGLQLAVRQGFGGTHGLEKARWMVDAVYNWFLENNDIEPYELEDFLADILDHEFDTITEDGSLNAVATNVCTNFQLCKSGCHQSVLDQIQKAPAARLGDCVTDGTENMEEDERMDEGGAVQDANMQAMLGGMRLGQSQEQPSERSREVNEHMPGCSTASSSSQSSSAAAAAAASELSESRQQDDEEDGWKVVRKSKKK